MSLVDQNADGNDRGQQVQWSQPRYETEKLDAQAPYRQSGDHPRQPAAQFRMRYELSHTRLASHPPVTLDDQAASAPTTIREVAM